MNSPTSFAEKLQLLTTFLKQPKPSGYAVAVFRDERILEHLETHLVITAEQAYGLISQTDFSIPSEDSLLERLQSGKGIVDGLIISGLAQVIKTGEKLEQLVFLRDPKILYELGMPLLFWIKEAEVELLSDFDPNWRLRLAFLPVLFSENLEEIDLDQLEGSGEDWEEDDEEADWEEGELSAEEVEIMATHEFLTEHILPKAQQALDQRDPTSVWAILQPQIDALLAQTAANHLAHLSDLLFQIGKTELAHQAYTRALATLTPGRRAKEAHILRHLGQIERERGELTSAVIHLTKARKHLQIQINISRRPEHLAALALTLEQLGLLHQQQAQLSEAKKLFEQTLPLLEEAQQSLEDLERVKGHLEELR